jgi:hypothetical protein
MSCTFAESEIETVIINRKQIYSPPFKKCGGSQIYLGKLTGWEDGDKNFKYEGFVTPLTIFLDAIGAECTLLQFYALLNVGDEVEWHFAKRTDKPDSKTPQGLLERVQILESQPK